MKKGVTLEFFSSRGKSLSRKIINSESTKLHYSQSLCEAINLAIVVVGFF